MELHPAPPVVQDENAPVLNTLQPPSPAVHHKAALATATSAPPEDPALEQLTSPRAPGASLFLSQPSLLLDTLEDIQNASPRSGSAADSSDDETENDPEAEAQRDLLEAESMLRYGLAKLSEITERHGRAVIEEHVRVFEHGPDDGIVALSKMLERACARVPNGGDGAAAMADVAGAEPAPPSPQADEPPTAAEAPDDVVPSVPKSAEDDDASLAPSSGEADATMAALSHVSDEFNQKVNALLAQARAAAAVSAVAEGSAEEEAVAHKGLTQEELAVLFSEVLLRNALAFLRRCARDVVDGVYLRLSDCGEELGSTGFDLLQAMLNDARAQGRLDGARQARDFALAQQQAEQEDAPREGGGEVEGSASPARAERAPEGQRTPVRAGMAEAEAEAELPNGDAHEGPPEQEEEQEQSAALLSLLSASDMAASVLTRVMGEYDQNIVALAERLPVGQETAQLLLAEGLLKPALSFLRGLGEADMQAFWQLGDRLHDLEPAEENGSQLLAQLIREVAENTAPTDGAPAAAEAEGQPAAMAAASSRPAAAMWQQLAPVAATAALGVFVLWRAGALRFAARMFVPNDACISMGFFEC